MPETTPTILAALDAHAARTPLALALDDVSYGELRDASLRVAGGLRERGLRAGDRVVLYAENSREFAFAYLGVLRAAAVAVPANVLYREVDLARVVDDSEAALVAVSAASRAFVPARYADRLLELADVAAWVAAKRPTVPERFPPAPSELLAVLIYTSGTTGRAKGAMLTHGNLGAIAAQVTTAWRWTPADTLLLALPLFHVHGLGAGLGGTLFAGGRVLLRERFEAFEVAASLRRGDATMFFGVPTMYVRLLEAPGAGAKFDRVRLFVSGSAALPASVHAAFEVRFGPSILERYGSTEFGFALTNRYEGPRYPGTVGFPFPGVRVRLVDAADRDVPAGAVGEIIVSGPNLSTGYWRNPEATAAAFFREPDGTRWYRSGDLATYDSERGYSIVGRTKELIISGGFNIYPREIEDELLNVPGIRAAAVIGRPDPARGELPVAFVEADDAIDEAAIVTALKARLASFKIPGSVIRIDALPRNAMGKVDKPALRALP